MDLIGPAFGGDVDGRAGIASKLGGVRIGDDLEFLDRIDRRPHHLRGQLLDVFRYRVVVDPIENEVVLQRSHAVNVKPARAPEAGPAALIGVAVALHARHQAHQVVPASQQEWIL